jgi:murein DD-endopeptidase MepM/ murein hydrolase activator NlpD
MAHMQDGSIMVEAGMKVKAGQEIGAVGNSGNTTEPHLHIHAELNGEGVPLRFSGRFLARNSVVR